LLRQQLTITGIAGVEEIEDGMLHGFHHTESPASKAFNESCPRRLMSLVLPLQDWIMWLTERAKLDVTWPDAQRCCLEPLSHI